MITSIANGRVKRIVQLQEKSKARNKENVFIAEGFKMFEEAPLEKIKEIYAQENIFEGTDGYALFQKISDCKKAGIETEIVTEEVFQKMSDTRSPQGILCVMEQSGYQSHELIQKALLRQKEENRAPVFLLLEDIQDPGNLGTMIRTGEGAGIDGIFMTRKTVDIYNPKTIRSTMGSLYRVPFVYADDLGEMILLLRKAGIRTYAAHLEGKQSFDEISYREGSAFLIGNEGNGLKKETADLADIYVKIPMEGQVESLNAAVSAALLMYQAAGQRRRIKG